MRRGRLQRYEVSCVGLLGTLLALTTRPDKFGLSAFGGDRCGALFGNGGGTEVRLAYNRLGAVVGKL